ncbi:hypothetical protein L6164_015693 [Bauhinia variegata]|uniref:Uncharacterized protein n=1 Tax=Bauhinia variegata TaxID=167791 RepID=A0ACB9NLF8_BAUVA|nr:hypothetical protein L6164_015693 [Bauhinia variegata]
MASPEKGLEDQLNEAGNKLLDPPQSLDELLPLLDQIENCLSKVEQSPSKSMQSALSPSLKALISNQLLKHSNVDVTVAVAACISEITRITAPEAPYDDEQMKEVFQLIVSSFENLFDTSSQSYKKRTSILETVAKVRSCVVMLDLECDALILEMFQHFFKAVRECQPENVFSAVETIMTLVLEESEDIPLELLSPILDSVKKENEESLPFAHKLGEKVLERCATKLRPYLVQAVKSLDISLDDYSTILASICQEESGNLDQNDATSKHVEDESKSAKEDSTQVAKEEAREAAPSEQVDPAGDRSPKSVMSNGIAQAGEDDSLADSKSLKKLEDDIVRSSQSKEMNNSSSEEPNNLKTGKVDTKEQKPEQANKRKGGRKSSASTKLAEPSESSAVVKEKETGKSLDSKSHGKDIPSSPQEGHSIEAAGPSENDKEIHSKVSSPKEVDDESEVAPSPSPSESLRDDRSKKSGRTKKKDSMFKEGTVPTEDVPKKESEGTSDSEAKPTRRLAKRAIGGTSDGKKTVVDTNKKGSGTTGDLEMKRQSAKKVESIKISGGSSSKLPEDKNKRRSRGKAISAKDEDKEMVSSPKTVSKSTKNEQDSEETPKTSSKRKRTSGKENVSNIKEYDEGIVGSRVKVWWPKDRMSYEGVVDSFDPVKKKHKIMYDDGDEEILNLKKETFEIIEDESDKEGEEGNNHESPNASAEMPPKKKGKTSAGDSTKQGKMDVSSKSGGGASSSKSKGASTKAGRKTKVNSKSKDSKTVGKSEDEVSRKSKDHTSKSGSSKSVDTSARMSKSKNSDTPKTSKSKDDDVSTPKPSAKSKQETLRSGKSKQETSNASKGKPSKGGRKSNVNGTGKMKSGSSKAKDDENSEDSTKAAEDTKSKTPNSPKTQGTEAKTGKKRRRGQN